MVASVIPLSFRCADASDANAIRELTRAAYARWVPVIGREPKPMTADYDQAVRDHLMDLAFDGSDLVGVVEMVNRHDCLWIENVAVAPTRQRGSLGTALVLHAEEKAVALGHACIRLYTNKLFSSNIRFYGALGFNIDREEALPHGTAVHMSKVVIPAPGGAL